MRNFLYVALCATAVGACGSDDVDSDEEARRAYLCLDKSIGKSLTLGFAGFNAASSANIDPQMTTGDAAGTLTITGQVDQGSSDNKGMRLYVGMVDYDDGPVVYNDDGDEVHVIFDTPTAQADQPYLNLKLANFPNGTLTGTLDSNSTMTGVYLLDGDIQGELTLNLTISGVTMAGAVLGDVVRVPGMTTITGTAKSSEGGTYEINITI
jgi:hypothetical protein